MRMLRLGSIPWIMPTIKQMQFQLALGLHKYLILKLLPYTKLYLDLGYRPKKTGNFCRETNDDFGLFAVSSGCRGAQPNPRSFLTANGPEWTRINRDKAGERPHAR